MITIVEKQQISITVVVGDESTCLNNVVGGAIMKEAKCVGLVAMLCCGRGRFGGRQPTFFRLSANSLPLQSGHAAQTLYQLARGSPHHPQFLAPNSQNPRPRPLFQFPPSPSPSLLLRPPQHHFALLPRPFAPKKI